jgi:hypothetical protein
MPGLKAIADPLEGTAQSRAVSWHAAGVGIAGAASFAVAGLFDALGGPSAAFAIAAVVMPRDLPPHPDAAPHGAPLDCRLVFRNRRAMAWIVGYTVHTWEMAALRGWAVAFLAATAARLGGPGWMPSPAVLFTAAGLAVSVTGNETAQKYGRARVVLWAMTAAAGLSLATGWTIGVSVVLEAAAVVLWNVAIYFDSSALTTGTV